MLSENNEDTDGLRGSRQGGYLVSGSWMITEIICYIVIMSLYGSFCKKVTWGCIYNFTENIL